MSFKIIIITAEKENAAGSGFSMLPHKIAGKTVLQHVTDAAQLSGAQEIVTIAENADKLPEGFFYAECNVAVIYGNMPLMTPERMETLAHTYTTEESLLHEIKCKTHKPNEEMQEQFFAVKNRIDLAKAAAIMQKRINEQHMLSGVTMINPEQTYIDCGVTIGTDTIIYPNVIIEGDTVIGENCTIGANSKITNMVIGNYVKIENSTLTSSSIGDFTTVGPYAYVRPNCKIGEHVKVGDFVETKNSVIGNNTKMSHLTYIGDADVGENINFGCGTVMVNYDGKNKARVTIEDNAFIGCNSNLIAPVTVSEGAYIAAGSTITADVPKKSLAIARARQIIKTNWTDKRDI